MMSEKDERLFSFVFYLFSVSNDTSSTCGE